MSALFEQLKGALSPELLTGTAIGGAGFWLAFKRFLVISAVESANISASGAYNEIIENLRIEVRRLSEVNTELAKALNDLQRENIELKAEVSSLHDTLSHVRNEFARFRKQNEDDLK